MSKFNDGPMAGQDVPTEQVGFGEIHILEDVKLEVTEAFRDKRPPLPRTGAYKLRDDGNYDWAGWLPETEESTRTYETPLGRLTVTRVELIRREPYSGERQVVERRLHSVDISADGDWLSDEMANELAAAMLEGGPWPTWLGPA